MFNFLKIARREAGRLTTRFSGRSRAVILLATAATFLLMFLVFQHGITLNTDMYAIGASPDFPAISDGRFNVVVTDRDRGYDLVDAGTLDLYIDTSTVYYRNDDRSRYAVDALKQYLENHELQRIAGQYGFDSAFPLRVGLERINISQESTSSSLVPALSPASPSVDASPALVSVTTVPQNTLVPSILPVASGLPSAGGMGNVSTEINTIGQGSPIGFIKSSDVVIPSLMDPPLPISEVMLAFLYIVPLFFISIFFTSSFMDEKTNKKLSILLSTPVRPRDIILGKLLPYLLFSMAIVVIVAFLTGANIAVMVAIFLPVILFIFSIYLLVAIFYRTFKDQSFFSMAAIALVTGYLVFPALFSGINDLSLLSPLTMAVKAYKGDAFGLSEYLFSAGPMYLVFLVTLVLSIRVFNEEYLQSYGPLYRKLTDAVYHAVDRGHVLVSAMAVSILSVPVIYMMQLIIIALTFNLPAPYNLHAILLLGVFLEEAGKSLGIMVMLERKLMGSAAQVVAASFLASLGFLAAEKAITFITASMVSGVLFSDLLSNSSLLLIPLLAHFGFTLLICLILKFFGSRSYLPALLLASALHYLYDLYMLRVIH